MARNGHAGAVRRDLLLRVERTCRSSEPTSDFDPERTRAGGSFAMHRMVCVQSMLYHSPSFPWWKPDEAAEVYFTYRKRRSYINRCIASTEGYTQPVFRHMQLCHIISSTT